MSIIFEALKKATKETLEPEEKSQGAEVTKPGILYLNKTAITTLLIILGLGSLFFFTFKGDDATSKKSPLQEIKAPTSMVTTTVKSAAEGYVPPQPVPKQEPQPVTIFKPIISNPRLSLSGIIYGIGKPAAIIENKIVEEGESIKGSKVVKIYADRVELLNESSGEIFILKVQ